MSRVHSPLAVEQAQRRLREVLVELRAAAEQDLQAPAYYRLWLTKLVEVMSAESGEIFVLKSDARWEPIFKLSSTAAAPEDEGALQRRTEGLEEVRRTSQPAIQAGSTLTAITYPFIVAGELRRAGAA